jgi:hypothetical protein
LGYAFKKRGWQIRWCGLFGIKYERETPQGWSSMSLKH